MTSVIAFGEFSCIVTILSGRIHQYLSLVAELP